MPPKRSTLSGNIRAQAVELAAISRGIDLQLWFVASEIARK